MSWVIRSHNTHEMYCTFIIQFTEEEFDKRTRQGHNNQTVLVAKDPESSSVYGVKRQAALNNSRFFHVVDGLPCDIMHDILEGILPRHVKTMLNQFINVAKIFTLQELNNRISTFPYGLTDSTKKPSPITNLSTADGQLRQVNYNKL